MLMCMVCGAAGNRGIGRNVSCWKSALFVAFAHILCDVKARRSAQMRWFDLYAALPLYTYLCIYLCMYVYINGYVIYSIHE